MSGYPKDMEDLDCVTTAIHSNDLSQLHGYMYNYPNDIEDLDCATTAIHASDHFQLNMHM